MQAARRDDHDQTMDDQHTGAACAHRVRVTPHALPTELIHRPIHSSVQLLSFKHLSGCARIIRHPLHPTHIPPPSPNHRVRPCWPARLANPPRGEAAPSIHQQTMNIQIPGFSSGDQARGLQNFITDIRNCTSREAEQQRIDKELANIRSKFASSSSLTPYQVSSSRQAGRRGIDLGVVGW